MIREQHGPVTSSPYIVFTHSSSLFPVDVLVDDNQLDLELLHLEFFTGGSCITGFNASPAGFLIAGYC